MFVSGVQQSDSVMHTHISTLSDSFPVWVITEYWVESFSTLRLSPALLLPPVSPPLSILLLPSVHSLHCLSHLFCLLLTPSPATPPFSCVKGCGIRLCWARQSSGGAPRKAPVPVRWSPRRSRRPPARLCPAPSRRPASARLPALGVCFLPSLDHFDFSLSLYSEVFSWSFQLGTCPSPDLSCLRGMFTFGPKRRKAESRAPLLSCPLVHSTMLRRGAGCEAGGSWAGAAAAYWRTGRICQLCPAKQETFNE